MATLTTLETWLQLPNESTRAYTAFAIYRDLGNQRSLDAVAEQTKLGKRTVARYSADHNWTGRVRDFDLNQHRRAQEIFDDEIRKEAREEAEKWRKRRAEFREKAFALGEKFLGRTEEMLKFPLQEMKRKDEDGKTTIIFTPIRWNANSIVHSARIAQDLMILATGLSPGSHPLDELDWDKLSSEDLEAILRDSSVKIDKDKFQ
jgi:hypothetical protein